MITRAVLRYVRITPRKARLIIPLIKGKKPEEAIAILTSVKKNVSGYAIDLLESAIANAKRLQGVELANLYISNFVVNGGPMMKRFRAASMGRASMIKKRTCHITVELDEISKKTAAAPAKETVKIKHKTPEEPKKKGKQEGVKKPNVKEMARKEHHKKGKE